MFGYQNTVNQLGQRRASIESATGTTGNILQPLRNIPTLGTQYAPNSTGIGSLEDRKRFEFEIQQQRLRRVQLSAASTASSSCISTVSNLSSSLANVDDLLKRYTDHAFISASSLTSGNLQRPKEPDKCPGIHLDTIPPPPISTQQQVVNQSSQSQHSVLSASPLSSSTPFPPSWCKAPPESLPQLYGQVWSYVKSPIHSAGSSSLYCDRNMLMNTLVSSGLPKEVLALIWSLVDESHSGTLTRPELFLALGYISLIQRSDPLEDAASIINRDAASLIPIPPPEPTLRIFKFQETLLTQEPLIPSISPLDDDDFSSIRGDCSVKQDEKVSCSREIGHSVTHVSASDGCLNVPFSPMSSPASAPAPIMMQNVLSSGNDQRLSLSSNLFTADNSDKYSAFKVLLSDDDVCETKPINQRADGLSIADGVDLFQSNIILEPETSRWAQFSSTKSFNPGKDESKPIQEEVVIFDQLKISTSDSVIPENNSKSTVGSISVPRPEEPTSKLFSDPIGNAKSEVTNVQLKAAPTIFSESPAAVASSSIISKLTTIPPPKRIETDTTYRVLRFAHTVMHRTFNILLVDNGHEESIRAIKSAKGIDFALDLQRVYDVVSRSMMWYRYEKGGGTGGNSELNRVAREIDSLWNALSDFLSKANPHLRFTRTGSDPALLKCPTPCRICHCGPLLVAPAPVGAKSRRGPEVGEGLIKYGANASGSTSCYYHASCANLWLNGIDSTLPTD